ncbi:MAG: hypothetical protein ACRED5_01575 [Propylenella sp.]
MHTVIFLGNTPSEIELLSAAGCTAFFSSQNVFVSERDFRPLPGVEVEFDAVYNARPVPEKRHELAAEIERVVYICGVTSVAEPPEARRIVADLLALGPKHIIVNDMADGLPGWLDRQAVNNALARAAVGLCLTAVEGAMYASVEYLLAGLPIVSTPSLGGREIFFDPDYCLIVEANPRAIREAVSALRRRDIPRQYVRERTLARLEPERQRFMAFVEDIKAQHGVPRAYETEWNYPEGLQLRWRRVEDHAGDFFGRDEAGRR